MNIVVIEVPELGNRSYLVHDGTLAIVIDPSRRIAQIRSVADSECVSIKAIFETHIHNDYVSGGLALAKTTGAQYYLSANDKVSFSHHKINDGETVNIGKLNVKVIASPGHTHNHLSYLVDDGTDNTALFSGGSLLYGSVGRTDLISDKDTKELAGKQYETAQKFIKSFKADTKLFPTHGFGSFCAAGETDNNGESTLGSETKSNSVYIVRDKSRFINELIAGFDAYPSYYSYMAAANSKGVSEWGGLPLVDLNAVQVKTAVHEGAGLVDLRSRKVFADRHIRGSYNIEFGDSVATYVGWLMPWEEPLIFIDDSSNADKANEQLSLIGKDNSAGKASADRLSSLMDSSYAVQTYNDLKNQDLNLITVLDVRRNSEWDKAHIPEAIHIPLHELSNKLSLIPKDRAVWVHCAAGYRAAMGASILSGSSYDVVLIDDKFENAIKLGLVDSDDKGLVQAVVSGEAVLVDVRETEEWAEAHAENALHLQVGRILNGDLSGLDKNKKIYLYCASGGRAGMAAAYLSAQGYDALSIGGLSDWKAAGGSILSL